MLLCKNPSKLRRSHLFVSFNPSFTIYSQLVCYSSCSTTWIWILKWRCIIVKFTESNERFSFKNNSKSIAMYKLISYIHAMKLKLFFYIKVTITLLPYIKEQRLRKKVNTTSKLKTKNKVRNIIWKHSKFLSV